MSKREDNEREIARLGEIAGVYKALGYAIWAYHTSEVVYNEKDLRELLRITGKSLSKLKAKAGEY